MAKANARKVEEANVRFVSNQRAAIFLGTDIPSTIVRKELIDNVEDVVSERKMAATRSVIKLSRNRLMVMDNGDGIDTHTDDPEELTSLWKAVSVLFSSSNYDGEEESLGNNGVGATISNMTSTDSKYLVFRGPKEIELEKKDVPSQLQDAGTVRGYIFHNGLLLGSPEQLEDVKQIEELESRIFDGMSEDEIKIFNRTMSAENVGSFAGVQRMINDNNQFRRDFRFDGLFFKKGDDATDLDGKNYRNFGQEYDQEKIKDYMSGMEPTPYLDDTKGLGTIVDASQAFEGDLVSNPMDFQEAKKKFDPYYDEGYMVDVLWPSRERRSFPDRQADIKWLREYAKARVGEMVAPGVIEMYVYADDDFTKELSHEAWTNRDFIATDYNDVEGLSKFQGNQRARAIEGIEVPVEHVKSWEDQVVEAGGTIRRNGPFKIGYFKEDQDIPHIVQGAPVTVSGGNHISYKFDVEGQSISQRIPFTFKYKSTDYPPYGDQTKVTLRLPGTEIRESFGGSGEIFEYFQKKAEEEFLQSQIQESESSGFLPATGDIENAELIIAEGYSAGSAIKQNRDPETQAIIQLTGKIKNVYDVSMKQALKNPIVKEVLGEVLSKPYKQVIIATDADPDGSHISTLLIGLFASFTRLIQDERLKLVYTPHYIFYNKKEKKWSEDANDQPRGWNTRTNKGLGSMTPDDIYEFIVNKENRKLITVVWNGDPSREALDFALNNGGQGWIEKR